MGVRPQSALVFTSCKMAVPAFKLNSGHTMPMVGLGMRKSKPGEVAAAVKAAIDIGYRHFDCAWMYGNEDEIGTAIKEKIKEGKITRSDIFITSKLWNTFHKPEDVLPSCKTSLSLLGLDYMDLYLMHWPTAFKRGDNPFPTDADGNILPDHTDPVETWKAMESLVTAGLVKSIGVSNFNHQQIQAIFEKGSIKPANVQVEIHPYLSNQKLVQYCLDKGVAVTAYSPLGSGDRPWATPDEPKLLDDPKLSNIAKKYGKAPAQIVLRWHMQRGIIVIPKSVTPTRIKDNFQILDFELNEDDMATINSFNRNARFVPPRIEENGKMVYQGHWCSHPHFPFNIEY